MPTSSPQESRSNPFWEGLPFRGCDVENIPGVKLVRYLPALFVFDHQSEIFELGRILVDRNLPRTRRRGNINLPPPLIQVQKISFVINLKIQVECSFLQLSS